MDLYKIYAMLLEWYTANGIFGDWNFFEILSSKSIKTPFSGMGKLHLLRKMADRVTKDHDQLKGEPIMKKAIAAALSALIVLPGLAVPMSAATAVSTSVNAPVVTYRQGEPTSEEMLAVIAKIKPLLSIPDRYSEFNWYYSAGSVDFPPTWSFTWSAPDSYSSISATCDDDGHLLSFYADKDINADADSASLLPNYLKAELVDTARAFLTKIEPEFAEQFVLTSTSGYGKSERYTYLFRREIHGIPLPSDTIRISLDNQTGAVLGYDSTFHRNAVIPSADQILSEDQAKEKLKANFTMTLAYREKRVPKEDGTFDYVGYLVYTPSNSSIAIDAHTGEIYENMTTWQAADGSANMADKGYDMAAENTAMNGYYQYTEQELEQSELLSTLIPKETAIATVTGNPALYFPNGLTTVDARLTKTSASGRYPIADGDETYRWQLHFSNPNQDGYGYSYASATVDAQSGAILSFDARPYSYWYYDENGLDAPDVAYTMEQAQPILEAFLKQQLPDQFANSVLSSSGPYNVIQFLLSDDGNQIPVYGAYSYTYSRVNEGVPYPYNSIYGSVDGVTGKITSFSYYWYDNVVFESPKDAVGADQAKDLLLAADGFGLNYQIKQTYTYQTDHISTIYADANSLSTQGDSEESEERDDLDDETPSDTVDDKDAANPGGQEEDDLDDVDDGIHYEESVRLVFSMYDTYPYTLSAVTGKQVGYDGEPYAGTQEYVYSDIEGHWAERDIRIFADINAGFSGGKFLPDQRITQSEFKDLMNAVGYYGADLSAESTDLTADVAITRTDAVKMIVRALGFEQVAELQGIFRVDFTDGSDIQAKDIGYIAIAQGLSIIAGGDGNFRPYDPITRAEAVKLLSNTLATGKR